MRPKNIVTTNAGDCYHANEECTALRTGRVGNEAQGNDLRGIVRVTVADAEEFGRRPCAVCLDGKPVDVEQPRTARDELVGLSRVEKRRRQDWIRRERMRANGPVEKFTEAEIGDRDGWVCGLCRDPIDRSYRRPDPRSPSVDHVIAIASGGPHTRDNVQITHWGCNHECNAGDVLETLEQAQEHRVLLQRDFGAEAKVPDAETLLRRSQDWRSPDSFRAALRKAVAKHEAKKK